MQGVVLTGNLNEVDQGFRSPILPLGFSRHAEACQPRGVWRRLEGEFCIRCLQFGGHLRECDGSYAKPQQAEKSDTGCAQHEEDSGVAEPDPIEDPAPRRLRRRFGSCARVASGLLLARKIPTLHRPSRTFSQTLPFSTFLVARFPQMDQSAQEAASLCSAASATKNAKTTTLSRIMTREYTPRRSARKISLLLKSDGMSSTWRPAPQRLMKTGSIGSMLCRGVWSRGLRPYWCLRARG